jgi:hypothetical protein
VRDPHPGIVFNAQYDGDGVVVFKHACKLVAPPVKAVALGLLSRTSHSRRKRRFDPDC